MATRKELLKKMVRLSKEIELLLIAEIQAITLDRSQIQKQTAEIQAKIKVNKAKTEVMRAEREAMEAETAQLHASNEAMKLSLNVERSKSIH